MRKLLGSALTLAMLFPSQVSAHELFKNVTATGQIDLQAISARNVLDFVTRGNEASTNNDRLGSAQTRLMASIGLDLLDDVHGMVTLSKADRTYGDVGGSAAPDNGISQRLSGTAGDGVTGNIFVDQAYFKIDKIGGEVDATFGRQFFGNPGDLIIYFGPSDKPLFGLPVNAIDGARGDWSNDSLTVTALVAKADGSPLLTTAPADTDLRGVIASCKGEGNVHGSVYVWNALKHNTGGLGSSSGKNDNLYILGAKAKATMGDAWVKGEIAKNFGENRTIGSAGPSANYTGWGAMVNGGVKATVGGVGTVTPWGEAAYGTGQHDADSNHNHAFQQLNSDYRPGLIYGRFANNGNGLSSDTLGSGTGGGLPANEPGISNRIIVGVGVKVTPDSLNKLTIGAQATQFRTQTTATPTPVGGAEPFGGNKLLGTEYGIEATWAHSENVSLTGTVANFQPGGLIRAARNANANDHRVNSAQMAAFDVRVKFGGAGAR